MTDENVSDLSYADTLWKAADALRGQVDAAEYRHVVLGLLFRKYILSTATIPRNCRSGHRMRECAHSSRCSYESLRRRTLDCLQSCRQSSRRGAPRQGSRDNRRRHAEGAGRSQIAAQDSSRRIDSPEKKQTYSAKAGEALCEKAFQNEVQVEWRSKDRYGRILGHIYLGDRWTNKQMVAEGWALHFNRYSGDPDLDQGEVKAKAAGVRLWADKEPTPLWEFRAAAKAGATK